MTVSNRIHFWGPHCSLLLPTMMPSDPWEVFTDNGLSMASRSLRLVWNHTDHRPYLQLRGKKEARGSVTSCRWPVTILRSCVSINSCVIFTLDLLWFDHLAKIFSVWVGFQLERRKRGWTTLAVCPHKGRQATTTPRSIGLHTLLSFSLSKSSSFLLLLARGYKKGARVLRSWGSPPAPAPSAVPRKLYEG